jgi:hypothetical protein
MFCCVYWAYHGMVGLGIGRLVLLYTPIVVWYSGLGRD